MELSDGLREQIQRNLRAHGVHSLHAGERRAAAVVLALVEEGWGAQLPGYPAPPAWSTRAAVLLTRRAAGLRSHPGQWALPGGGRMPGRRRSRRPCANCKRKCGCTWMKASFSAGWTTS